MLEKTIAKKAILDSKHRLNRYYSRKNLMIEKTVAKKPTFLLKT